MATIEKFEDLDIWKKARELSLKIFEIISRGLFVNDYRFKSQIQAAGGSVMDNIAEGFERSSRLEFINFLGYAKGSCGEVKSQLYRAFDQKYIKEKDCKELVNLYTGLSAGIAGLISYLNKSNIKGGKFKDRQK
ncbi:four helix bundle protein [Niabella aquatica]